MRLTLRTLLAYLDDILPPAETKQLGEKIAATPAASQLVDRIRDVMRRRRLTAPEPDGSGGGIEPNLVAEYLDNNLAPERVADVERVCLESDVNLAEAAACHQILTLVLGEPVEITGRLRERMYALGPQGTPLEVPEAPAPSKRVREANAREQLAAIKAADKPAVKPAAKSLESRLPEYLRRKPLWKRVLPWAAIAVVIAVWLGLLYKDRSLFNRDSDAEGSRIAANALPAGDAQDAVEGDAVEGEQVPPAPRPRPESPIVAATELPDLPVDPEPPAEQQPLIGEDSPALTTDQPPGTERVATATATETATAEGEVTPQPVVPEPVGGAADGTGAERPVIEIAATNGVVLRDDLQSDEWFPVSSDDEPLSAAPIAVPEPFEAEITVSNLPLRATVLGGTRLSAFGRTDAANVGLDVAQGRIRFRVDSEQNPEIAQLMFGLQLGKGLWRIEPLTIDTVLGIEALPLQPTFFEQDLSARTPQGVVYVASGAVRVADASGRVEVASAGNRIILTRSGGGDFATAAPATATVGDEAVPTGNDAVPAGDDVVDAAPEPATTPPTDAASSEPSLSEESPFDVTPVDATPVDATPVDATPVATAPVDADSADASPDDAAPAEVDAGPGAADPLAGVPDWLTPREPTSSARKAMVAFQKEFIEGAPVGQSLLPAVSSPYYYVAEPAAKAIGLIENLDGMVKSLRDAEHEEAILATIDGLRNWLGRSPAHGERLQQSLGQIFAREGLADTLYELLWGYSLEDARNENTARQLVEWLDHPEPVVRELAFYHVKRLSGRTMYYRPLQSAGQRAGAVNRWRDFVSRNGGLIVGD